MRSIRNLHRRAFTWTSAGVAATAVAGALAMTMSVTAASAAPRAASHDDHAFSFKLVPSPGIKACLPNAGGNVTITPGKQNDTMKVWIHGMPKNAEFDLFVIEEPNKPFGISWYQTDVNAGRDGKGSATVKGIFDRETFSVSPALSPTVSFAPTHQFHLGLWFNNPNTPFKLGCEPGAVTPAITPFNGEQHAGIQALNTAQFPVNAGPLSHVHR